MHSFSTLLHASDTHIYPCPLHLSLPVEPLVSCYIRHLPLDISHPESSKQMPFANSSGKYVFPCPATSWHTGPLSFPFHPDSRVPSQGFAWHMQCVLAHGVTKSGIHLPFLLWEHCHHLDQSSLNIPEFLKKKKESCRFIARTKFLNIYFYI